ncbi:MAG: DNA recombination protein RmuC [Alphaproteobacteria bacterium]
MGNKLFKNKKMIDSTIIILFFSIVVIILLYIQLNQNRKNKNNSDNDISEIIKQNSELNITIKSLSDLFNGNHDRLKNSIEDIKDKINQQVQKELSESREKTHEDLTKLSERLAVIDNAQKNITDLSNNVIDLQGILSNKQQRGAFGQGRMESIISDALPNDFYSFQYTLSNSKRPDCIIKMPNTDELLVIDSKFPLESFNDLRAAKTSIDKKNASSKIKTDVTKHINDISEKYKIPGEVRDPLLMFIPSESVCADLYENFDDLFQKAYKLGIIIVSPNTLMLSVQTLQTLIRDAQMQKQIGIIKAEVGKILMDVDRLGIRVEDLQKHFNLANKDIENIVASSKKITSSGRKIQVLESNNSQETIEKN